MAGCGFSCAKYTLFFFNACFWLVGLGILAVGIWMTVDNSLFEYLKLGSFDKDSDQIKYAAYFLIAAGGVIVIIGFCGCCGAIKESQCLLGFYVFCIVLIIGLEIAAGVFAYIKRDAIIDQVAVVMKEGLEKQYDGSNPLSFAWHKAMMEFDCCGVEGPIDWETSEWVSSAANQAAGDFVPQACCKVLSDDSFKNPVAADNDACQLDAVNLPSTSAVLRTKGCKDAVVEWLTGRAVILIGIAFAVAAFEVLVLILALCVCCQIRRKE